MENLCLLEALGFHKMPDVPPFRDCCVLTGSVLRTPQLFTSLSPAFPHQVLSGTWHDQGQDGRRVEKVRKRNPVKTPWIRGDALIIHSNNQQLLGLTTHFSTNLGQFAYLHELSASTSVLRRSVVSDSLLRHQTSLSMGFSWQEYWNALPGTPPGNLPELGIKPASATPALAGGFFTTSATCILGSNNKNNSSYLLELLLRIKSHSVCKRHSSSHVRTQEMSTMTI